MNSIDYIKESLNTLRIEFMAHILIIIALGSGLSRMYLEHNKMEILNLYTFGVILFCIVVLNLIFTIFKLNTEIRKLK